MDARKNFIKEMHDEIEHQKLRSEKVHNLIITKVCISTWRIYRFFSSSMLNI